MVPRLGRRACLIGGAGAAATTLSGCLGGGSDDTDDSGDPPDQTPATAATETPEPTATPTPTPTPTPTAATFTLEIQRAYYAYGLDEFESLVARFDGFEFRSSDGESHRLEGDGTTIDLTTLSSSSRRELVGTGIPTFRYDEVAVELPIVSATMADGSEPPAFTGVDPHVRSTYTSDVSTGDEVTITLFVDVERASQSSDYTYNMGYSSSTL